MRSRSFVRVGLVVLAMVFVVGAEALRVQGAEAQESVLVLALHPREAVRYKRDLYLPRWSDGDGDCQNLRHELLIERSLIEPTLSAKGCRVLYGLWYDPYTGLFHTEARDLDIDHRVALKEAHDSGGHSWTAERRHIFAEDTSNLVITASVVNRPKGAKDPAAWLPELNSCGYLQAWLATKAKYGLAMDGQEQAAIVTTQKAYHCKT